MKVKFGDLTVMQVKEICSKHCPSCEKCPLNPSTMCFVASNIYAPVLNKEIDLPDEEVEGE